jgi:hypothetical protein
VAFPLTYVFPALPLLSHLSLNSARTIAAMRRP